MSLYLTYRSCDTNYVNHIADVIHHNKLLAGLGERFCIPLLYFYRDEYAARLSWTRLSVGFFVHGFLNVGYPTQNLSRTDLKEAYRRSAAMNRSQKLDPKLIGK